MLTSCRSTSSAYFSKDKNGKKCQRHLNFKIHTSAKGSEAIATLLTQPCAAIWTETSAASYFRFLLSSAFLGPAISRATEPLRGEHAQRFSRVHKAGLPATARCCWGKILHNPSSQVEKTGLPPREWRQGEQEGPNMHAHTRTQAHHTRKHAYTHPRIWLPSTYKCRKMPCIGLFSPQDLCSASG